MKLSEVDMKPENVDRIRAAARAHIGHESGLSVWERRLVPASALAFAAAYLLWAAAKADLILLR